MANPPNPWSGPYKIAASLGTLSTTQSSTQLVRTSGGVLYAVLASGKRVSVWKSSDNGKIWTQPDYGRGPTTTSTGIAAAIDNSGIIHIAYIFLGTSARYVQFSTTTDTFNIKEIIPNAGSVSSIAIAIDSNSVPHVAYTDNSASTVIYTNRPINYPVPYWQPKVTIVSGVNT